LAPDLVQAPLPTSFEVLKLGNGDLVACDETFVNNSNDSIDPAERNPENTLKPERSFHSVKVKFVNFGVTPSTTL
jgi:hypothetical protein